jgi:hypothetical protein
MRPEFDARKNTARRQVPVSRDDIGHIAERGVDCPQPVAASQSQTSWGAQ